MATAPLECKRAPPDEESLLVAMESFNTLMSGQMLRVNVLMTGSAILMGVMVGIGAYGHRYRHHPLTRFVFIGATVLFLPIVSYIMSITGGHFTVADKSSEGLTIGGCYSYQHMIQVLVWASFVQIIGINTTSIVAADDREGRSIAPPVQLLVQAVWTAYLGAILIIDKDGDFPLRSMTRELFLPYQIIFALFAVIFVKIIFKYYAWYSATRSFSFGRNPRLIVAYMMKHLPVNDIPHAAAEQHVPPPLYVSRENSMVLGKHPHGYQIMSSNSRSSSRARGHGWLSTTNNKRGCLVTMDKVWELDESLLKSIGQDKDVCFSFALFKMLRCHFARYNVTEAPGFIKACDFLWNVLLKDSDGTRTLGVIATELSFLQDYYYSSLPTSYSKDWLPILSIFISLSSIGCCLLVAYSLVPSLGRLWYSSQITCTVSFEYNPFYGESTSFGNMLFDALPLLLVVALVVLSEVWEIVFYVCSDWTKVALMCRYVSWREYPTLQKCIGLLLRPRCKLVRPWKDYMNQCSIIVLHPRKFRSGALLRCIFPLPEQKNSVKVPKEVKDAIVNALRSSSSSSSNNNTRGDDLRNGKMCWQQLGIKVGDNFIRARDTKGTSDTLLAWHIATTIFKARNPPSLSSSSSGSVATHLSCYCAYLVAYSPELLQDDDKWSKSLYKATRKGAEAALRNAVTKATPEDEYRQLVDLLSTAESEHGVLKEGARLGEELVGLMKGLEEKAAWNALAGFWCEMILYIAPSDNLDGHAVAVARGGELITLLWALLIHVGIHKAAVDA